MIQAMKNLNLLQKKWYVIDSQTAKDKYNQSNSIKFESESIRSSLCDYSDAFILVTGDITGAPFYTCKAETNDLFIDDANHIYSAMPMYNLIEYIDNYSDTSGSLWQFKRDEVPNNNADLTIDNSQSFKFEAALVGKKADAVNNTNSSIKVSKQLLEIIRNAINQLQNSS